MLVEKAVRRLRKIGSHFVANLTGQTTLAGSAFQLSPSMVGIGTHQVEGMSSKRRKLGPEDVYIVGVARTPLGSFQGGLAHLSATDLGGIAIQAAVHRAGIPSEAVEEVLMGNVCSANLGQAPARQAALKGGLPIGTDATLVNKVCSSGLKAIVLGAQTISTGSNSIVIAGGMESMSNIPYYAPAMRQGARLGNATLVDGLLEDGLSDATYGIHMGECAELCAEKYGITREQQDAHAIESVARARQATADGSFAWEIVPVARPHPKKSAGTNDQGAALMLSEDEAMLKMDPEKLRRLTPFFRQDGGTVTAGNASPITDGAAAVVLASAEAARRLRLPVLARILGFADAAQDPKEFPTSPAVAIPLALKRAGVEKEEVDYWEVNEAFSVVDLVNKKLLGLDPQRVNVFGGSVALGHPIGASGARLLITLLNVLRVKEGKVGVAAICNGGGGASVMVVERVNNIDAV